MADKNLKLKNDKGWAEHSLNRADKVLEEALHCYTGAVEQAAYWYENIYWLQKRFPKAKYQDVVGLCKMADKTEYADEQDYSLNAGRYVGVEIEDDNISEEEFFSILFEKKVAFTALNNYSHELENLIESNLKSLINV